MPATHVALAFVAAMAAGCSYDWDLAPGDEAGDGAVVPEAGPADAATDASSAGETSIPPDAPGDTASAADVIEADAPPLPACTAAQEAQLRQKRAAAIACTALEPCEVSVQDECGCPLYVAGLDQAEASYVSAVITLLQTCIPSCSPPCPSSTPYSCYAGDAGGGPTCH